MSNPSNRSLSRIVILVLVIVAAAAAIYLVTSRGDGSGSVPDRTNDEMEVAPS